MVELKTLLARRRLLVLLAVIMGLAAIGMVNNLGTVAQVGTTTAVVGISKTPTTSPTEAEIDVAVRQAVALAGGLPDNVGPGKKIVIQPNMVEAGWVWNNPAHVGVCTNRQVVRTLVNMCLEAGATIDNIIICEGSAGFHNGTDGYSTRQMTIKAFRDCGYDLNGDMIDDATGAQLLDANNVGYRYPDYPGYSGSYNSAYVTQITKGFLINRRYFIPNAVAQCDVLIRVPVLKNHDLAGFTGGLKLAFGIAPTDIYHYPGLDYYKWALLHQQSWGYNELETNARGMADMTLCRPPDLVVVDGLVGITTGPTREPLGRANPYMACIIAGRDVVAVDTIAALACGYKTDVNSIPGIVRARELGLGTDDPGKIEVRGYHVKDIRRWFPAYGCADPGDQTPPTLGGLTVPDGVHVCGQLTVAPTGFYDANPGLCKGELYIDGILQDSNDSSANGYRTSWLVTNQSEGAHTLTYTLYDKMLNETSLSRTIYVHRGDPLLAAQVLPDGTAVSLGTVIFTGATPAIDGNTFFVSSPDGLRGLRVRYGGTAPSLTPGQKIAVYGTLSTNGGQRYLNCTSYTVYGMGDPVKPRYFQNRFLGGADLNAYTSGVSNPVGPYNLGCLVKTSGRVISHGSDYFFITDGSITVGRDGINGLKVKCGSIGKPAIGSYVTVVGLSCCENDGSAVRRMLVVRSASDIISQ